jgi:hypothetical protein
MRELKQEINRFATTLDNSTSHEQLMENSQTQESAPTYMQYDSRYSTTNDYFQPSVQVQPPLEAQYPLDTKHDDGGKRQSPGVFRPRQSDDWKQYREIIEGLCRNEQLKLRDVKRIMEKDHHFFASYYYPFLHSILLIPSLLAISPKFLSLVKNNTKIVSLNGMSESILKPKKFI